MKNFPFKTEEEAVDYIVSLGDIKVNSYELMKRFSIDIVEAQRSCRVKGNPLVANSAILTLAASLYFLLETKKLEKV